MTGKTEKHLDSATYKNYYVHVFRLLSGNEFDGTPCDYGEHGSVVAAGVASLKLLINFETEAAVVHAVAEDPLLDNKHRRSCLASGRSLAPPPFVPSLVLDFSLCSFGLCRYPSSPFEQGHAQLLGSELSF